MQLKQQLFKQMALNTLSITAFYINTLSLSVQRFKCYMF